MAKDNFSVEEMNKEKGKEEIIDIETEQKI